MRKIIGIILVMLCICSCSLRKTEEYDLEEIKSMSNNLPFSSQVEWIVEPSIIIDSVEMLATESPFGYPVLERTGHPQEWNYMAGKGPFIVDQKEYIGAPAYTSDAICVTLEKDHAIYDYEGNLLRENTFTYYVTHEYDGAFKDYMEKFLRENSINS